MKTKLLAMMILAAGTTFARSHVSIGVGVGVGTPYSYGYAAAPPPPPRGYYARPVAPGPGYVWVDGFYAPYGREYRWTPGYWTRPPRNGSRWIAPRYDRGRYFNGYWR